MATAQRCGTWAARTGSDECYTAKHFSLEYCPTSLMRADIFTKAFSCKVRWWHATTLIAHVDPVELWSGKKGRKSPEKGVATAPAPPDSQDDRFVMEFCCSADSEIGRVTAASKGCKVERITIENDVTTSDGLKYALGLAREAC